MVCVVLFIHEKASWPPARRLFYFNSLNTIMSLSKKWTTEDEYFVELVVSGIPNMDAYMMSHPRYKERTKATNDTELCYYLKTPKITEALENAKAAIRERSTLTVEYMLDKLRELIEDPTVRANDRIKSMELAGKFQGAFTQKVQHSGGVAVEHSITPEMASAIDDLLR